MSKKMTVKFYSKGDVDKDGSVLYYAPSKSAALSYIKDWLNAHSTKMYPFHKVANMDRWESKFTAVYIVTTK